jgi:uncharacterized Rmd1/YagE family protein
LAISLAVAQSAKLTWLEWLLDDTIDRTRRIPLEFTGSGSDLYRRLVDS